MRNFLYVILLSSTLSVCLEMPAPSADVPLPSPEEFPTIAINLTIHNNHQIKQTNANSSSIEQSVNEEQNDKKDDMLPDSLRRFIRILGGLALR